jgi:hypothetical protein
VKPAGVSCPRQKAVPRFGAGVIAGLLCTAGRRALPPPKSLRWVFGTLLGVPPETHRMIRFGG